jgi:hypothetical protein
VRANLVLMVCVAGGGLVWWVRCHRGWIEVCVMGLTGVHAMKISVYIPRFLCCWATI